MAESRMLSRVTIRRRTGRMAQNEGNGTEYPVWETVATAVPFRLGGSSSGSATSRNVDVVGVEVQRALRTGHLPASQADLADDDYLDITAGENAGLVLRVVEAEWQDQATARRVPVIAEDRPEEWA